MKTQSRARAGSKGYTILEVMLFLAISSGLALIAFLGLGPRLINVRFTDATRAIQSDINREVVNGQLGVSRVGDGPKCRRQIDPFYSPNGQPEIISVASDQRTGGSSEDCIINGQLAFIIERGVEYHSLISLRQPISGGSCDNPADTFADLTRCYKPRIARDFIGSLEKPLVKFIDNRSGLTASANAGGPFPIGFGYLQDPKGSSKYFFTFSSSADNNANNTLINTQFVNGAPGPSMNSQEITADTKVCLRLRGREAVLVFKPGAQEPELKSERCS